MRFHDHLNNTDTMRDLANHLALGVNADEIKNKIVNTLDIDNISVADFKRIASFIYNYSPIDSESDSSSPGSAAVVAVPAPEGSSESPDAAANVAEDKKPETTMESTNTGTGENSTSDEPVLKPVTGGGRRQRKYHKNHKKSKKQSNKKMRFHKKSKRNTKRR